MTAIDPAIANAFRCNKLWCWKEDAEVTHSKQCVCNRQFSVVTNLWRAGFTVEKIAEMTNAPSIEAVRLIIEEHQFFEKCKGVPIDEEMQHLAQINKQVKELLGLAGKHIWP